MRHPIVLQAHDHTGKLIHHRHTSYGILALLLLLPIGLLGWVKSNMTQIAQADQLYVYAIVPAPVPTTPAVITSPSDGAVLSDQHGIVSGTCPIIVPAISVAIYDNGILLGSAPCTDGLFQAQITLFLGKNELIARTFTVTGGSGPDSLPVHVTYAPQLPSITYVFSAEQWHRHDPQLARWSDHTNFSQPAYYPK
jgi:hypothetical protein